MDAVKFSFIPAEKFLGKLNQHELEAADKGGVWGFSTAWSFEH